MSHKVKCLLMDIKRGLSFYYKKSICTYVNLDLPNTFISSAKFMRFIVTNVLRKSLRLSPSSVRSNVGID